MHVTSLLRHADVMEAEAHTKVLAGDARAASEPVVPDRPPVSLLVGRYELIHRLGHGGMATVHLGRAIGKAGFERLVAVKVIHPHLASEPEFVEMFLDEARIAAKIHHPHVVEILDLGEEGEVLFMVMEYVEGDTLSSLVRQLRKEDERLPVAAILQIAADACEGLAAAHELTDADGKPLGIVHRDVSPHNLLVSMDGRVKVVDFGIMKAAGKRSSTLTGQLRGKVAYMSPEQAGGKVVDQRTDVFALGVVLWELCTGRRLFDGQTQSEMLLRVSECDVPSLGDLRPDLPEGVVRLVHRALARDPDDRHPTAQAMLKEVRAQLRQLDCEEEPREQLAEIVTRHFGARIDYLRATIRGRAANDRSVTPVPARPVDDADLSKTTPIGPMHEAFVPLPRPTSSGVASLPLAGTTATTTATALAPRQWTLWLLLPLVGAAIGTAAMSLRGDASGPSEPIPQAADRVPSEPMAPARTVSPPEPAPPAPASPDTVKWWFNTDPQGASVIVDGRRYEDATPMAIELPRSEETVEVRIEKDGYTTRVLHLAPVGPENHSYPLQPEPRFRARTAKKSRDRPRSTQGARDRGSHGAESHTASSRSDRTLEPPPDFAGIIKSKGSSSE